ncbi:MAG: hypothetical protein ACYSWO_28420 [Planctomycetota bacterium]
MSEYIAKTYGPGNIAALPPTIGATSRAPTIGAEDAGVPIPSISGLFGLGTNGTNGATPAWALPVGIGLALGGLYVMFAKQRDHGGIFPNMGDEPSCNGCGLQHNF